MNLNDIITAIGHNIDETIGTSESASTFYTQEQVIGWINQAIKQLVNDLPPQILLDLHQTLSGTLASSISLPTNFMRPVSLKIDGYMAKIVPPTEYWLDEGNPYSFADYYGVLYGNSLMELHPSATTYELKYVSGPTEYTTASDLTQSPPIPPQYHNAIVHYATYLALRRDKEVAGDYLELYMLATGRSVKNEP